MIGPRQFGYDHGNHMKRTAVLVGLSFALGATLVGGVAVATTKSAASVKACATHKGALTLLSPKGKCAKGSRSVTIAKQGPRGPRGTTGSQGPGAKSSVAISTSSSETANIEGATVHAGGTALAIHTECLVDSHAEIFITGAGDYLVTGPAQLDTSGGTADASFTFNGEHFAQPLTDQIGAGGSVIGFENDNPTAATTSDIDVVDTNGSQNLATDLLVAEGKLSFTVNVALFVNGTNCAASAQVTPGGIPAT
jgi:hypothetical protein